MVYDTFSERQRLAKMTADVYQYEEVPQKLRVQVQQILRDAIGPHIRMGAYDMSSPSDNKGCWRSIHKVLCKEFGVHELTRADTQGDEVIAYLGVCSAMHFVDVVEVCVRMLDRVLRNWSDHDRRSHGINQKAEEALEEINLRFRRSGFGFQFHDGEAFRVDSEYLHQEAVVPALRLLNQEGYEGARLEFLNAHEHFKNGNHEEAITEAGKAFESTLKIACDQSGWTYAVGARASDLLNVLRTNKVWPDYLDASFEQLLATLKSGLPKVRNEQSAHGQGSTPRETPAYIAAYALHLAASKILFVAGAIKARSEREICAAALR